jgi:hypothetical protein
MLHRYRLIACLAGLTFAASFVQPTAAAGPGDAETTAVLTLDSQFWTAYNACNTGAFRQFFTPDVEFYHDKGGMTVGADALLASLNSGVCGGTTRLRREAVDGTVHVYLLRKQEEIYGAVIAGEHRFYVREPGQSERLDGQARFTSVWLVRDTGWKMGRILSYDHGRAPYVSARHAVPVPDAILDGLIGEYRADHSGILRIKRAAGFLLMSFDNGDPDLKVYPSSTREFFLAERDVTFEFATDAATGAVIMSVREGGTIVDRAVRR